MIKIRGEEIIEFQKSKEAGYFFAKRPEEVYKNPYRYGQTILLKGGKNMYEGLIGFWLSCEAWYSSDGQDFLHREVVYEDITREECKNYMKDEVKMTRWLDYVNSSIKLIENEEKEKLILRIKWILKEVEVKDMIGMYPLDWDDMRVIFTDNENYYLFYFWTGE